MLWSPETVRSSADGPHFRRSGGGYEVVTEKNGTVEPGTEFAMVFE